MPNSDHGLIMKFLKSWVRKKNFLNSLTIKGNYEATMIDYNESVVTW